jgi:quercetin dioxygenase-like cupin family protein
MLRVFAALLMLVGMTLAQNPTPHPHVISLDTGGAIEFPILPPPDSVGMMSGLVTLALGHWVGKHTTGQHEEMLIILEGKGKMTFTTGEALPVEPGHALYCPPKTEHNVTNTGNTTLRYIYVVAPTLAEK